MFSLFEDDYSNYNYYIFEIFFGHINLHIHSICHIPKTKTIKIDLILLEDTFSLNEKLSQFNMYPSYIFMSIWYRRFKYGSNMGHIDIVLTYR